MRGLTEFSCQPYVESLWVSVDGPVAEFCRQLSPQGLRIALRIKSEYKDLTQRDFNVIVSPISGKTGFSTVEITLGGAL